jgi:hypothetical protein
VKVVDHTLHHRGGGSDSVTPVYASVIIYAKRQEDLPVVSTVGDIIRIHRASMKDFNGQKQFHVNVYYNSSWCLFKTRFDPDNEEQGNDSDQENEDTKINTAMGDDQSMIDEEKKHDKEEKRRYRPFRFSGKSFTFDANHEKPLLDDLRRWACNYFE